MLKIKIKMLRGSRQLSTSAPWLEVCYLGRLSKRRKRGECEGAGKGGGRRVPLSQENLFVSFIYSIVNLRIEEFVALFKDAHINIGQNSPLSDSINAQ